MKKIKVGIDYDEPVFSWYEYAHDAALAAGLADPTADFPTSWAPFDHYGCTLEEWVEVIDAEVEKGADGMYGRPLLPGAVRAIQRLVNAGMEVHLVTARGQFGSVGERIKELTRAQVHEYKLPVAGLHFAKDKREVIRTLGLKYFLDDRPKHFVEAEAGGASAYLLDATWNADFDVPSDRRVYSTLEYADRVIEQEQFESLVR